MLFRTTLLFVLTFLVFNVSAQDKIYLRKKGMMEVKIMYVSGGRIIYRNLDDPGGKDRAIDWDDVHKVEYENGKVDFRHPLPEPHLKPVIFEGKNIFSIAPVYIGGEGVGSGIAYERVLDKDAFLSLYLPVGIIYASPDNSSAFTEAPLARNRTIFQFMPGIKLYPTRNNGRIRYAVGPQLSYEGGDKWTATRKTTAAGTNYFFLEHHTLQEFGVMVNNSINMFPSPQIYMGFDLGLGVAVSNRLSGKEAGVKEMVQFNFRMGYRR